MEALTIQSMRPDIQEVSTNVCSDGVSSDHIEWSDKNYACILELAI